MVICLPSLREAAQTSQKANIEELHTIHIMSSRVPQEANMCDIKYTNIVRQSGFAGCVKGLEWEGCNLGGEARLQKLRGRV